MAVASRVKNLLKLFIRPQNETLSPQAKLTFQEINYFDIVELIRVSQEILFSLTSRLPDELLVSLKEHLPAESRIIALFSRDFIDTDYLEMLLKEKFSLFEAMTIDTSAIFFDREIAFSLPSLTPIKEPFPLSCKLMWSRIGRVIKCKGIVEDLAIAPYPGVKLKSGLPIWAYFKKGTVDVEALLGKEAEVIGISSFLLNTDPCAGMILDGLKITPIRLKKAPLR